MYQIHEGATRGLQKEKVDMEADEVATVWQTVGKIVVSSLAQNKGCRITGFGSFSMQKGEPVFTMAADFGRANGLKQKTGLGKTDNVPHTALNYALFAELGVPLPRATVEKIVQKIIYVLGREVRGGQSVLVTLKGVCEMTVGHGELRCDFSPDLAAGLRQAASAAPPLRVMPALAGALAAQQQLTARPGSRGGLASPPGSARAAGESYTYGRRPQGAPGASPRPASAAGGSARVGARVSRRLSSARSS